VLLARCVCVHAVVRCVCARPGAALCGLMLLPLGSAAAPLACPVCARSVCLLVSAVFLAQQHLAAMVCVCVSVALKPQPSQSLCCGPWEREGSACALCVGCPPPGKRQPGCCSSPLLCCWCSGCVWGVLWSVGSVRVRLMRMGRGAGPMQLPCVSPTAVQGRGSVPAAGARVRAAYGGAAGVVWGRAERRGVADGALVSVPTGKGAVPKGLQGTPRQR